MAEFREICIVITCRAASVTACHNNKFFDGSAFDCVNDFICQSEDLVMCKPSYKFAAFQLCGRRALFSVFNDSREIFCFPDFSINMFTAGKTYPSL